MNRKKVTIKSRANDNSADDCYEPLRIPSIEEQFKSLQPTREILDFYRSRLNQHEKEYNILIEKVNKCKIICEEGIASDADQIQRNDELFTLQKALSDLQVYLNQERNQVLKLHSENDRLRIQLAKDRKIIKFLLSLCGTSEEQVYFLMKSSDKNDAIFQPHPHRMKAEENPQTEEPGVEKDADILTLKLNALTCQLDEHMKISQDEIHSLHQDRELIQLEREKDHEKLQNQIKHLTDRLNKTQISLCDSTRELVELKRECDRKEEVWLLEKEAYRQGKLSFKEKSVEIPAWVENPPHKTKIRKEVLVKGIKEQLQKKDKLIKLYKEQCSSLEKELWNLNQTKEKSYNLLQEKIDNLSKQLCWIKGKYAVLCRRRAQEAEGFRNDVKILKDRLRSLDRKFSSANYSIKVPQRKEILDSAKATLAKANSLQKELNHINHKLSVLELDSVKWKTIE